MDIVVRRRLGAAVWVLGAVVATGWGAARGWRLEGNGIGYAPPRTLSALEPGRVGALPVPLLADVQATDVVAQLDPTPLQEARAVLEAQVQATAERAAGDVATLERQFAQGRDSTRLQRATLETTRQADEALARTLRERVARERAVADAGAAPRAVADDLQRELQIVEARLTATRAALRVAEAAALAAEARASDAPPPAHWDAEAAQRALAQMDARLHRLAIAAGIDGRVTGLFVQPGDWVDAGVPIAQVTATTTRDVVGWFPAQAVGAIAPGDAADVVTATGAVLHGTVRAVGDGPTEEPAQLWTDPQRTEWGVPVRVELADGVAVAPNEPVTVRL
jgi:multidrug resistance efflux pump